MARSDTKDCTRRGTRAAGALHLTTSRCATPRAKGAARRYHCMSLPHAVRAGTAVPDGLATSASRIRSLVHSV
ncbi:uncharacterized protein SOCEGT47_073110 [Sorangium cellulosum]|uniref:Uncharacterized protein n=1 Tax=Sorangium cellulosum TaxID=56 RepID=A0A4P2QBM3_SORCE|nr:uncharacterized protein SOCEGT47_073110 [Sorangium cellulosum]